MSNLLPFLTIATSLVLGGIILQNLSIKPKGLAWVSSVITIGTVIYTALNYLSSYIIPFPQNIWVTQLLIIGGETIFLVKNKHFLKDTVANLRSIAQEKDLIFLFLLFGIVLGLLFHTHIILDIKGDLYTGESTYGDLPFHLSTIAQITYGKHFPPQNPLFVDIPLVYPYLINFFSAILVYQGMSLRDSIIIPGILLSLALVGLVYNFAYVITKSKLISFLTVILYFLHGGIGFYFFLKDYSFNISSILTALLNPASLKEYSHFFEQNIQWANFISRMIVPERSILFGIPSGLIILRLLFFRESNSQLKIFDIIFISFLLSLMPLLHTHTLLAFIVILPIIAIANFDQKIILKQVLTYTKIALLSFILVTPHIPLFLNHIGGDTKFFTLHLGWMTGPDENFIWFWFKNSYLLIPLAIGALVFPKVINRQIIILLLSAFCLFFLMNLILFSPFNWDNVKFLFWIGLFFSLASSCFIAHLLKLRSTFIKVLVIATLITMISSASLSIYREVNVKFMLFSKDGVKLANTIKETTPTNSRILTYKIHNSPVSNLAGRNIFMGYPGSLWVHGIKFQNREKDIDEIYKGTENAKLLLDKYNVNYVLIESYDPQGMIINREFFNQYQVAVKTENYSLYKIK